jgi:hypothetical protein
VTGRYSGMGRASSESRRRPCSDSIGLDIPQQSLVIAPSSTPRRHAVVHAGQLSALPLPLPIQEPRHIPDKPLCILKQKPMPTVRVHLQPRVSQLPAQHERILRRDERIVMTRRHERRLRDRRQQQVWSWVRAPAQIRLRQCHGGGRRLSRALDLGASRLTTRRNALTCGIASRGRRRWRREWEGRKR